MENLILHKNQNTRDEIINNYSGFHQVVAPAGAGKTSVIVHRIVKILSDNPSSRIVAFAFNTMAADELNLRVKKELNKNGLDHYQKNIVIGTIHEYCYKILTDFIPDYSDFKIMDDMSRYCFVSKKSNYNQLSLYSLPKLNLAFYSKTKQNTKRVQTINVFLKSCDLIREENVKVDDYSNSNEFKFSFTKYVEMLLANRLFDFSSIICETVKQLENNDIFRSNVLNSCEYLIVDEYQDINNIQDRLIRLLSHDKNLMVVGDEDQCIYQFRGSHLKHFLDFEKTYPNVKRHYLEINFRSSEKVVEIGSSLICQNNNRTTKIISSNPANLIQYNDGDIIFKKFENDYHEIQDICDDIQNKIGLDFKNSKGEEFTLSYSDIAILVRTNGSASRVSEILKKNNIPIISSNPNYLLKQGEIQLIIDSIFFIMDLIPGMGQYVEDSPLIRMYQDIFQIDDFDPEHFSDTYFINLYESNFDLLSGDSFYDKLIVLRDNFKKQKSFDLQGLVYKILSCIGLEHGKISESKNLNFAKFTSVVLEFLNHHPLTVKKDIFEFIEFLWGYVMDNTEAGGLIVENVDAVRVLTIHKSKGLEFPCVYIPHFNSHNYPISEKPLITYLKDDSDFIENYKSRLEDERRLLYVAITRSEKFLRFSYSDYTRGRKSKISPFANEFNIKELPEIDNVVRQFHTFQKRTKLTKSTKTQGDIRNYILCPNLFYLKNIIGYEMGIPVAYGYGQQIHKIIDILHKSFTQLPPSKSEIKSIIESTFYLRYATKDIEENLKFGAIELINNYVNSNKSLFNQSTNTEEDFEFIHEDTLIRGSIDMISNINGEYHLIDIKTDEEADVIHYQDQIKIYAIACQESLGLTIDKAILYEIKSDKKIEIDVSPTSLNEAKNHYSQIIENMDQNNFQAKPTNKCSECDMKLICCEKI